MPHNFAMFCSANNLSNLSDTFRIWSYEFARREQRKPPELSKCMCFFLSFFLSLFSSLFSHLSQNSKYGWTSLWSLVRMCVPCVQVATPLFVKHLYKHKFPSWPWVQYTWSLRCLGFKTGHFALRREENIVELVEPPFRNQKLSLVHTKNNWTFIWIFPFHLCLLTVYVLPRNVVWKPTAAWWDSRIPRRLYSQAKSSVPPRFH